MDSPIDYSAEVARIYELTYDTEREDAYASLASRLREERDVANASLEKLAKAMKEARWQEPQVGQLPFDRGYNLAMTQVQRAITGDAAG